MINLKGKINFAGILMILAVLYGAFVAYKLISVQYESNQVKKEIVDKIGLSRGPDFSIDDAYKSIIDVLVAHDIAALGEEIRIDGQEDPFKIEPPGGAESSDSTSTPSTPPTPPAPKSEKARNIAISAKFEDNKSKIKFSVQYEIDVNLIFFKQTKNLLLAEEITNFN